MPYWLRTPIKVSSAPNPLSNPRHLVRLALDNIGLWYTRCRVFLRQPSMRDTTIFAQMP